MLVAGKGLPSLAKVWKLNGRSGELMRGADLNSFGRHWHSRL